MNFLYCFGKRKVRFKLLFIFILILPGVEAFTQVHTNPAFPSEDKPVTIFFDATKGSQGLLNYTGDVYVHIGVLTNLSDPDNPGDWRYVKTDWGVNTASTKLERVDDNLYKITIQNIRSYFGIPSSEQVQKIAMVFRSSDSGKEGKGENETDIFVELFGEGVHVKFSNPTEKSTLLEMEEELDIEVIAGAIGVEFQELKLYQNDLLIQVSENDSISFSFSPSLPGKTTFKAVVTGTNGNSDSTQIYAIVPDEVQIENRPAGIVQGIYYHNDPAKVTLSLLAPYKELIYVIGDFNDWQISPEYQLKKDVVAVDEVYWWIEISGLQPGEEYAFQYLVDNEIRIADPYSEKVLHMDDRWIEPETYPDLKTYPIAFTNEYVGVLEPGKPEFQWSDQNYEQPAKEELVIYELLIRDFTEEHSFQSVIDKLDYLQNLGINAIELLPVNEFEGNNSWGYNPAFYFAPDRYYGPAEDLKKLVDEAHNRGIAVILDMVFNHSFGQSPMVRLYNEDNYGKPTSENIWFNVEARHPFNVGSDFDHSSRFTQKFIDDVNRYWIKEFHIDGYRYDLSKGFTQNHTTNVGDWNLKDDSRIYYLNRMREEVQKIDPDAYLILEHLANNDEEKILADSGFMLWGIMHEQYKEAVLGYDGDFTQISSKARGWNDQYLVGYMESHDEERIMYEALHYGNKATAYDVSLPQTALNRMKAAHAFLLAVPGPKMIWQFGELGYDKSIGLCTNGTIHKENCRTAEKPILWNYFDDADRVRLYKTIAEIAKLKTSYDAFKTSDFELDVWGKHKRLLLKSGIDFQLLGNFDVISADVYPYTHNSSSGKWWYEYFSGDSIFVSGSSAPVTLAPGEFEVYSTVKLPTPEAGLIRELFPEIEIIPATISFSERYSESEEAVFQKSLTIRNSGSANLIITDISTLSDVFSINSTTAVIAPGDVKEFTVYFNPTSFGNFNAEFVVESVDLTKTFSVSGEYLQSTPSKVELILPLHQQQLVDIPLQFVWEEVDNAEVYELQILNQDGEVVLTESSISETSVQVTELDFNTSYSWKVRAQNNYGYGAWSDVYTFTTKPPVPEQTTLLNPADSTENVSTSPVLSWSQSEFAYSYNIQVSLASDFSSLIYSDSSLTQNNAQLTGLSANTVYYWRVKAVNISGESEWSDVHSFTTSSLVTPVALNPVNDEKNVSLSAALIWSQSVNADNYTLQLSEHENFRIKAELTDLTDTLLTTDLLKKNKRYFWRVRAHSGEESSEWSATSSFYTVFDKPERPQLISPEPDAAHIPDNQLLKWNKAELAHFYQLQLSKNTDFHSNEIDTNLTYNEFSTAGFIERNTNYNWRVRSINYSDSSNWSDTLSFSTLPALPSIVTLLTPADSSLDVRTDIILKWRSSGVNAEYQFQLSKSSDFSVRFDSTLASDTSLTIPLEYDQIYFWKVRAINSGGAGEWSKSHVFKTIIELPEKPTPASPLNDEIIMPSNNQFIWTKAKRANFYEIQISEKSEFNNVSFDSTQILSQEIENVSLSFGKKYYWRVRGSNRAGYGDWSNVISFQTTIAVSNEKEDLPKHFGLSQNYPNPFNPATVINYQLPYASDVMIEIFDITGRKVSTLVNKKQSAGFHSIRFNAADFASGTYFYRMQAAGFNQVKKFMLIK